MLICFTPRLWIYSNLLLLPLHCQRVVAVNTNSKRLTQFKYKILCKTHLPVFARYSALSGDSRLSSAPRRWFNSGLDSSDVSVRSWSCCHGDLAPMTSGRWLANNEPVRLLCTNADITVPKRLWLRWQDNWQQTITFRLKRGPNN